MDITEKLPLTSMVPSRFHILSSPLISIQYTLSIYLRQKYFEQSIIILALSIFGNQKSESESEVVQSCPTLCDPVDCIAHQAPRSLGFSRQEYWSGLPFPSPGDLPDPGIESRSPTLQADALTSDPPENQKNAKLKFGNWVYVAGVADNRILIDFLFFLDFSSF